MINTSLRTGLSLSVDGQTPASFREIIQMQPAELSATLQTKPITGRRALETLARIKYVACFPAAVAAYPYIRMRGHKGTYLYCLARRTD
jgi:hypothetical protein